MKTTLKQRRRHALIAATIFHIKKKTDSRNRKIAIARKNNKSKPDYE